MATTKVRISILLLVLLAFACWTALLGLEPDQHAGSNWLQIPVVRSQETKKPQEPCAHPSKVFVLSPDEIEAKVKELNAAGYCVTTENFVISVDGKVVLLVRESDLEGAEDPKCESGEECD